jgi:hypothetical protein
MIQQVLFLASVLTLLTDSFVLFNVDIAQLIIFLDLVSGLCTQSAAWSPFIPVLCW